jgi:hypothetical protein
MAARRRPRAAYPSAMLGASAIAFSAADCAFGNSTLRSHTVAF